MAPRQRRRKASKASRVAAIVGANALALLLLWRLLSGSPAAGEGVAQARSEPSAVLAGAPREASHAAALSRTKRTALEREIRSIVARHVDEARELSKGKAHADNVAISVHVRELGSEDGGEIALDADRSMRPASNLKLITTAAALVLLGPAWQFDTRFEASGPIEAGKLRGDLVVRAAGDPLYDPAANGSIDAMLEPALRELAARGIAVVQGDLVLDEGSFRDPAPGPSWPEEGQRWAEYCALAGGFSANRGCLTASVSPTRAGEAARVSVEPHAHGLDENFGVRCESGGPLSIQMHARASGVLVRGTIPRGSKPWSDSFAHPDPVELFGHALSAALAEHGIVVQGRLVRERDRPPGTTVAHLRSDLASLLVPINTDSTNAVADQVFLATGLAVRGSATREEAARATAQALEQLGVPSKGLVQVDGSGLSRDNRVTARQITTLLAAVLTQNATSAKLYRASLAVAGESGTLDDRMQKSPARGRVQAKTGFIGGTSALSGVVRAEGDSEFVFSILVDYPEIDGLNKNCWKPMQDEICEALVRAQP